MKTTCWMIWHTCSGFVYRYKPVRATTESGENIILMEPEWEYDPRRYAIIANAIRLAKRKQRRIAA